MRVFFVLPFSLKRFRLQFNRRNGNKKRRKERAEQKAGNLIFGPCVGISRTKGMPIIKYSTECVFIPIEQFPVEIKIANADYKMLISALFD